MPRELRRKPDGSLKSKYWYGACVVNGKRLVRNLDVEVRGEAPQSLRGKGDREFEASRDDATFALRKFVEDERSQGHSEEYVQKLHEIKTGRRIGSIPLTELAEAWDKAPRKRKGSPRYVKQAHSLFSRFVASVRGKYAGTRTLADVTPDMAETFMQAERERGVSGRTCNAALILLRSAFRVLAHRANIVRNPFDGIPTIDEQTTHRMPFNEAELNAILTAAKDDDFIRPILVTGICTAMRRGDCCTLRWGDVDLQEGFVRVKTSKTGETVEIPMFNMLREELVAHQKVLGIPKGPAPEEFVFNEQAKMYQQNPQGITWRVRQLFKAAGFFDVKEDEEDEKKDEAKKKRERRKAKLKVVDVPEQKKRVARMFKRLTDADGSLSKRTKMAEAFKRYIKGDSQAAIAEAMGLSKSTISLYLGEIEDKTETKIVREQTDESKPLAPLAPVTRISESGGRRVSIRDFHSFRVTWITLALSAGVPLELVQRVTGHKTTEVVLKHYFKPGRDAFKHAIESAMPAMLVGVTAPAVVLEKTENYVTQAGPGELLEKALNDLAAVKSKSKRLASAVKRVKEAKKWIDGHVVREVEAVRV